MSSRSNRLRLFSEDFATRPGPLSLLQEGQLAVELQGVVWDRVVIALNCGLSFELQNRHLWLLS